MPDRPDSEAPRPRGFSTRAIRIASRAPEVSQRSTTVPIYPAATFASASADELAAVVDGTIPGYAYARLANPTTSALETAVADLEGAPACRSFASGMAALHALFAALLQAGDRLLVSVNCYGSVRALVTGHFAGLGVRVEFVDVTDLAAVEAALAAAPTRVLHAETIANPTMVVADHAALAELAHRYGALYSVDNTFASPYVCRPIEFGADLVAESATKWMGGHSDVLGGVVSGSTELIAAVDRVRVNTGGNLGPFEAFLVLRGIQTLAVRMDRHAATAATIGAWLELQPGVRGVRYPGLPGHPQRAIAARQFRNGGGMLAFELAGDRGVGPAFIDALEHTELTASLGSVHTMVVHPSTTSHRQLTDAELAEAGIAQGLLRVSVGLEDPEDLLDDLGRALEAVRPLLDLVPAAAG